MALPVPLMLDCMRMLAMMAQQKQATSHAMQRQTLQAKLRALEIQAQREEIAARKEIMLSLIAASQHVFDRKMDFFTAAFNRLQDLIANHQQSLIDEKQTLKDRSFDPLTSDAQLVRINNRLGEISVTLIDLDKVAAVIAREFNERVSALNMETGHLRLPGA